MADVGRGNRTVMLYPRFDPGNPADRLGLVREVVALANSGGGEILFGVESPGGDRPGLDRDRCVLRRRVAVGSHRRQRRAGPRRDLDRLRPGGPPRPARDLGRGRPPGEAPARLLERGPVSDRGGRGHDLPAEHGRDPARREDGARHGGRSPPVDRRGRPGRAAAHAAGPDARLVAPAWCLAQHRARGG